MKNIITLFLLSIIVAFYSCGEKKTIVIIDTEFGQMKAELYDSTPKHKANFIKLVNEGFYNDLLFHRVMKNFMIQGGDPKSRGAAAGVRLGTGGPGYTIDAEIGAPHFKGTLAAARTGGASNPEKKSSGSQFYIVHGRELNEAQLKGIAQRKGIEYNETQMKKYIELGGTPNLDMDYTVFGELITGFDVLDKIAEVQTPQGDTRPIEDVKMTITLD